MGQPLDEERWGANGDSLQRTTNGLIVWRKADNWTAFTDGTSTWINGPAGVQSRPNCERFGWEDPGVHPGWVDLNVGDLDDWVLADQWVGEDAEAINSVAYPLEFALANAVSSGLGTYQQRYERIGPDGPESLFLWTMILHPHQRMMFGRNNPAPKDLIAPPDGVDGRWELYWSDSYNYSTAYFNVDFGRVMHRGYYKVPKRRPEHDSDVRRWVATINKRLLQVKLDAPLANWEQASPCRPRVWDLLASDKDVMPTWKRTDGVGKFWKWSRGNGSGYASESLGAVTEYYLSNNPDPTGELRLFSITAGIMSHPSKDEAAGWVHDMRGLFDAVHDWAVDVPTLGYAGVNPGPDTVHMFARKVAFTVRVSAYIGCKTLLPPETTKAIRNQPALYSAMVELLRKQVEQLP